MGICGGSIQPEHIQDENKDIVNDIANETRRRTITPSTTSPGIDEENEDSIPGKHSYDSILSSPGQLEIPEKFKKWFPPRHGHKHVRKLFKWHGKLGHGVTGSVYKIEYKQQMCAVKQVEKNDQWSRMLFTTEARVLSKLRHCGIIGFIDMFFDERYYYLVLEKADFDLYYVMKKKGHLSERKTRSITYAILKATSYMHKKNLAHRDLKPENIVFVATDTNQPRLIDFGDAEMVKKDKVYTEFVGTPPYMSPERLDEHRGWQLKKADIWAIAVIAYEMYCGDRCFDGDNQKQVFGRILRNEWHWPRERKAPSDDMKDFINICLSDDAKDRPCANAALQHKWFDAKRKEEEQEERQRQLLLQQQLKLNDIAAINSNITVDDDENNNNVSYEKLNSPSTHDSTNVNVIKIKDITQINLFDNLASMVESNPLQDILVKGYIQTIKDDDLAPYKQQFDKLDSDKDGFITGTDLVNAFTSSGKIGANQAASLASIIISELDVTRNGKISFRQFLAARLKYDFSHKPRQIFENILAMSSNRLLTEKDRNEFRNELKMDTQSEMSKQISGFESEYSENRSNILKENVNENNNNNKNNYGTNIIYNNDCNNGISRQDIITFAQSLTNLECDEKERLHEIFDKFDKDSDDILTFSEFVQAVYSTRVVDTPIINCNNNKKNNGRISNHTYTANSENTAEHTDHSDNIINELQKSSSFQ